MPLTINIVFTPGTVALLNFMTRSVLHWSPCSFRLVSNACLPPEERHLERLAARDERLEFHRLPTSMVWPHGQALNYLHDVSQGEYFAFMDSDILASGDFLTDIEGALSTHVAVFAGAPVWAGAADQVMPDEFQLMSGQYNRTAGGHPIGGTYFAIYDNAALRDIRRAYDVGFDEVVGNSVRSSWHAELLAMNLMKASYDTGKLVNALMIVNGHSLAVTETSALTHLGGTSFVPLTRQRTRWWSDLPAVSNVRSWRSRRLAERGFLNMGVSVDEARAEARIRIRQRNPVRRHFWQLLRALSTTQPIPAVPALDRREIEQRLAAAADSIGRAFQQFGVPAEGKPS